MSLNLDAAIPSLPVYPAYALKGIQAKALPTTPPLEDYGVLHLGWDPGICIFSKELQEIPMQPFWVLSRRTIILNKTKS